MLQKYLWKRRINVFGELGITRCIKYVPVEWHYRSLRQRSSWGHMCAPTPIFFGSSCIKIHQSMWIQKMCISWPFGVNILRWPLHDLWVGVRSVNLPTVSFYPSSMEIHQSMWIQWPIMHILTIWVNDLKWPLHDFWPNFCWGYMCTNFFLQNPPAELRILARVIV